MSESEVPGAGDTRAGGDDAGEQTGSGLLQMVVDLAVAGLGGVEAASISVAGSEDGGYKTLSASHPLATEMDQIQYRSGGPCVDAIAAASAVMETLPSKRWPEFSRAAAGAGAAAVWSLPLDVSAEVAASLNLYASTGRPWDGDRAGLAAGLAAGAATILDQCLALTRCEELNATLQRALETRTVIGQAQGMLMARQSIPAAEAFEILRRASQRTNRKLRDIADDIVSGMAAGHQAG